MCCCGWSGILNVGMVCAGQHGQAGEELVDAEKDLPKHKLIHSVGLMAADVKHNDLPPTSRGPTFAQVFLLLL